MPMLSTTRHTDIVQDYLPFRDQYGLTQPEGTTSQNGLRFTAEYVRALVRAGSLQPERHRIIKAVRRCEIVPGLYRRSPDNNGDQEGPDDYHGLALISYYLDPDISRDILRYGRRERWLGIIPKYIFNNVNPGKWSGSAWMGRQPALIAMHKVVAGERVGFLESIWIMGTILASDEQQDSFVLTWMLAIIMANRWWYVDWAIGKWQRKLKFNYALGIGQVSEEFFGHPHPNGKWLREDYGP